MKQDNLIPPHEVVRDFCVECGAHFPPRPGESICNGWKVCQSEQAAIRKSPRNIIDMMNDLLSKLAVILGMVRGRK